MNRALPSPQKNWALFLDLDGTLLDLADTPDSVIVPGGLLDSISALASWLNGALAIVSGRKMNELERLLSPVQLYLVAEHGAILRTPNSRLSRILAAHPIPRHVVEWIRSESRTWPGVLIEVKSHGVAVHVRQAPEYGPSVQSLLQKIVDADHDLVILPGKMVFELRTRKVNKGTAVSELMRQAPFWGRTPVFVGDDVTDEDGFLEVERQGGLALRVGDVFQGSPENVRRWLGCIPA